MISDASYSDTTKCAGLGVIDLHTGQKYSQSLCKIKSSQVAEYRALYLSVNIAIKNNYNNVVFVYDNQSLTLDTLKLWLVDKIQSYQFLWLKRAYVDNADKLAKKARTLQEKLIAHKSPSLMLDNNNLLHIFRNYSKRKILSACIKIASHEESLILTTHIKNKKYSPVLVSESSLDFYSDVYHLLSKPTAKKSYLKFIDKNYAKTIDRNKFLRAKPDEYYIELIQQIISRLTPPKQTIIKESKTLKEIALITAVKKHPVKSIVNFCAIIGTKEDQRLLDGYFSSKKVDTHTFDSNAIKLYMFIHSLLPKDRKNNFFRFIKKRIKDKKLEKKFIKSHNIDFQLEMLNKVISQKKDTHDHRYIK